MGVNIFAEKGNTAEHVTTEQNIVGTDDVVLRVDPERGTFLRLLNQVPQGSGEGIPHYLDLRDANGDPLPPQTAFEWRLKVAGQSQALKVSEEVDNIGDWLQLSLQQQRHNDHVDSTKVGLRNPEANGGGPRAQLDVRDIDELQFVLTCPTNIDWSQSTAYVESNALRGPFTKD
ncbi:hypothetical protein ACFQMA_09300 [Halosimplex aquaticum]|uniref:Uncharacterized protein n=1 Tax=Halosimplex aquaticum TaxID=3026162 RepID=A0ABD5XY79_9EURY|nr:hypothetical protein [Halosimplex aquaticum]